MLEGKIAELGEEKLAHMRESQEAIEAQKNFMDLQATDLKKRVQELQEKCDGLRVQLQKAKEAATPKATKEGPAAKSSDNEKQMLQQIKELRDELMAKEEENYHNVNSINDLREENSKL